ncbi:hypothetical protein [Polaromonas sp.]|uniref:hypothetical protein n=1 Tax=Polaromonas sp. TaxID=1869339 RepID=UPI002D1FA08E|nr:hypothetical protein [Polaromonas sp.]
MNIRSLTRLHLRNATFFIASGALFTWAAAQNSLQKDCLPANQMKAAQLFGLWTARFDNPPAGLPAQATVRLQRHAEFSDSLAGVVSRDIGGAGSQAGSTGLAARAALAGDLDEGMLLLDESSDNVSITGTWNGEMVEGSCGRVFRGTWKDTSASAKPDAPDLVFTLTRQR